MSANERVRGSRVDKGVLAMRLEKLKPYGIDFLFDAILTLRTPEECYAFFDDLCTINELKAFGQRLMVAKMLRDGETYAAIEAKTGASTATISRVKRSLHFGNDGYALVFERLEQAGKLPPAGAAFGDGREEAAAADPLQPPGSKAPAAHAGKAAGRGADAAALAAEVRDEEAPDEARVRRAAAPGLPSEA